MFEKLKVLKFLGKLLFVLILLGMVFISLYFGYFKIFSMFDINKEFKLFLTYIFVTVTIGLLALIVSLINEKKKGLSEKFNKNWMDSCCANN